MTVAPKSSSQLIGAPVFWLTFQVSGVTVVGFAAPVYVTVSTAARAALEPSRIAAALPGASRNARSIHRDAVRSPAPPRRRTAQTPTTAGGIGRTFSDLDGLFRHGPSLEMARRLTRPVGPGRLTRSLDCVKDACRPREEPVMTASTD